MDVEVTSHMQTLEDDQIKALDKVYKPEKSNASENKQQGQNQQNHQITSLMLIKR